MITYKTGNLLAANTQALVNTVNTVGIMGKGIALQFKETFPENYRAYSAACKKGEVQIGKMFVTATNRMDGIKYIINFPTKKHWRHPSKLEYIRSGLIDLRKIIVEKNIQSVAMPPLGCGNGGLNWADVKQLIDYYLVDLPITLIVFEPSDEVNAILAAENEKREAKLTPARAMMLNLLYYYRGLGEYASEFAAEKLTYFLLRMGEPQLKLDFQKHIYGPYSGKVRHVLFALNGTFLTGLSQKDAKPFQALPLLIDKKAEVDAYLEENTVASQKERLAKVKKLIDGFQSPAGLELLSSLDYLINEHKTFDCPVLSNELKNWSSRKEKMFSEFQIKVAINRLQEFRETLYHEF